MNLEKLFDTQKVLRDRIGYNEPDRINKLLLALLVELGECCQEWRGFKFWSKDQQPRTKKSRKPYMDLEDAEFYNPLLEEYVDSLHFILDIGLELGQVKRYKYLADINVEESITDQFRVVFWLASESVFKEYPEEWFNPLFTAFANLGGMLGFTWEEIEASYFEKNQINHARQDSGTY